MSETRKLAAILAADVVGYSRLMREDEAGTARAVRERREAAEPIVADHGGRIVKTTGDGLLIEFPSVVAAADCAIAIQKLMAERNADAPEDKRILYRIGVNLGDVLVEGDDILGDGVNIAARLEGICEPGGVFISGAAYDHVRGRVDAAFVDLGEKELKNIARPVRVYLVKPGAEIATPTPAASAPNKPEPPHLSIVVLPFASMTGDPEQEYFVDCRCPCRYPCTPWMVRGSRQEGHAGCDHQPRAGRIRRRLRSQRRNDGRRLAGEQEAGLDPGKYWLGSCNGKEKSWDWVKKGITTMDVNETPTLEADVAHQQTRPTSRASLTRRPSSTPWLRSPRATSTSTSWFLTAMTTT